MWGRRPEQQGKKKAQGGTSLSDLHYKPQRAGLALSYEF
jgi:hypothetical protein